MPGWVLSLVGAGVLTTPLPSDPATPVFKFGWPDHARASVEVTDERTVAGASQSFVLKMRMAIEPDPRTGALVVRFTDRRVVSMGGFPAGGAPTDTVRIAIARVMRKTMPTLLIGRDGRYLGSRDLDRVVSEVAKAAGLPDTAMLLPAMRSLIDGSAREDWDAWVECWVGKRLGPGDWVETDSTPEIDGVPVPVHVTRRGLRSDGPPGRALLEITTVYPSTAVKSYTAGVLIDMARESKELDEDDLVNTRFIQRAKFSPLTETITVDLEIATMRPYSVERVRTFFAEAGRHRVDGRERRAHRFVWEERP